MVDKEGEELEATMVASLSLEDSMVELKQLKAKSKSHFTKLRRCLLVSLQEQTVDIVSINTLCEQLDSAEEVLDIMTKLSDKYREKKNNEMCIKVSKEIEQIEQEYTSAQNRAQEMLDRKLLELKSAYQQEDRAPISSKFSFQSLWLLHKLLVSIPSSQSPLVPLHLDTV